MYFNYAVIVTLCLGDKFFIFPQYNNKNKQNLNNSHGDEKRSSKNVFNNETKTFNIKSRAYSYFHHTNTQIIYFFCCILYTKFIYAFSVFYISIFGTKLSQYWFIVQNALLYDKIVLSQVDTINNVISQCQHKTNQIIQRCH